MKRTLPLPAHLAETNPHEIATPAYWQWFLGRNKRLSRKVVIDPGPTSVQTGWETTESALGGMADWLKGEGAFWFYVDEALAAFAGAPSADVAALERTIKLCNAEIDALKAALAIKRDTLSKIHEWSANPT